ncbi:polysaccharide deacetylase family protein [Flavobacterium rhizosphaerae]|uniref:Polysaccharide deacetylase family protein n=1 Tax=Flavobacterium rhizosphaerae TaxID=3163298 RepID=A0ABW8YS66_9FLAO
MKWYWVKTGKIVKKLFSGYVWDKTVTGNTVYLTFDDGPTPGITTWILELLKQHDIKATFFCIGKNITANPKLFEQVAAEGHSIGNHTYNHVNGWHTDYKEYIDDMEACEATIANKVPVQKLFRPPYGKMKRKQGNFIRKKGYKIIMWDVLSADFDQSITPLQCLENVINNATAGSIIIFHDSLKAEKNLRFALPKTIETLKQKGYNFAALP